MIFTASASTIAAPSTASFAASAVAAISSIRLISDRLLLTVGDLEIAALQGRVSYAVAKGESDGWFIVAGEAAGG